jgi:hypothetical protein
MTTNPHRERPSDEANRKQLAIAQREGAAYQEGLRVMATEVADTGGTQQAGDYIVGFAQERAEGMYHLRGEGRLEWVEPEEENCHLEISVSDAGDGRFIPYLTIYATLTKDSGEAVGPVEMPFVWHPGLYHYGANLKVPGDGTYDLAVRIKPPNFMRHDEKNGKRYAETVEVSFPKVTIRTGRE